MRNVCVSVFVYTHTRAHTHTARQGKHPPGLLLDLVPVRRMRRLHQLLVGLPIRSEHLIKELRRLRPVRLQRLALKRLALCVLEASRSILAVIVT